MAKFGQGNTEENMMTHNAAGTFGYSAVGMGKLGGTEYTLATIVRDVSGSVQDFVNELNAATAEIVKACKHSPRHENLLVRLVDFSTQVMERHGFKLLEDCDPVEYLSGGKYEATIYDMTALYDAALDGIGAAIDFGAQLTKDDYSVNGCVYVITDGLRNCGKVTNAVAIRRALDRVKSEEAMESLIVVLIGVNVTDSSVSRHLKELERDGGFTKYLEVKDAKEGGLAKISQFVSKSISTESQKIAQQQGSKNLSI